MPRLYARDAPNGHYVASRKRDMPVSTVDLCDPNIMEATELTTTTDAPITTIAQIGTRDGQSVTIRGWLYNLRESGKLLFPIFRDGSGVIQGVMPKSAVSPEIFERVKHLTQESAVIVTGKV